MWACLRISSRSAGSGTWRSRRAELNCSQTSASKRSPKLSVSATASLSLSRRTASFAAPWDHAGTVPDIPESSRTVAGRPRAARLPSRRCAQFFEDLINCNVLVFLTSSVPVFELAGVETAIADHNTMRYSNQLRISEFDTGAQIAIVKQNIHAALAQFGIEFTRCISDTL